MLKDSCTRLTETQIQQIHYRRLKAIQQNLERYKLRLLAYNHLVAKAWKARMTSMNNKNSKLTDVQIQKIYQNRLEAICKKTKGVRTSLEYEEQSCASESPAREQVQCLEFQFLESPPRSEKHEVSKLFARETAVRRLQNLEEIIFQVLTDAKVHL